MSVKRCGRLDRHDPHQWIGRASSDFWGPLVPTLFACTGYVVIEGGAR